MELDPTTMIRVLGATLLATAALLALLPVGTCSECDHCRQQRFVQEQERARRAERFYGIPRCSICGRHHDPSEDHFM